MGLPLISPKVQFFDLNGNLLVGGKLLTKVVGGGADKTTYSDAALTTPNTNPIILDSRGEASVFAGSGEIFWLRLTDASDVTIWTKDDVAIPLDSIANGAVTEAKIATGAVTTTKLGDLSVTMAKLDTELVHDHTAVTMVTADDYVFIADVSDSNKNKKALIPAATEALKGIAQIATTAQVTNGTDDTAFVTPLKLTEALQSGISDTLTNVTTTGGTSIDFTGIPSWARRVTLLFDTLSTSGNSVVTVRVGNADPPEVTGYVGGLAGESAGVMISTAFSSGFRLEAACAATSSRRGRVVLERVSGNTWEACVSSSSVTGVSSHLSGAGSISLGGTLDRVRLTTEGGADTFDVVNVSLFWEG